MVTFPDAWHSFTISGLCRRIHAGLGHLIPGRPDFIRWSSLCAIFFTNPACNVPHPSVYHMRCKKVWASLLHVIHGLHKRHDVWRQTQNFDREVCESSCRQTNGNLTHCWLPAVIKYVKHKPNFAENIKCLSTISRASQNCEDFH
jgi:hypothetical protein